MVSYKKLLPALCIYIAYSLFVSCPTIKTEMEELFNYDPMIKGLPTGKDTRLAVITSHGILSNGQEYEKGFAPLTEKYNEQSILVTFNFPETRIFKPSTATSLWQKIKTLPLVTFGGILNAEILLFSAKKCVNAGCRIAFIGHSMGAAAIIRCLHILAQPQEHHSSLIKLGLAHIQEGIVTLDHTQINLIKSSITKIFLANPLLSVPNCNTSLTKKALSLCTCNSTTMTNLLTRPVSWMAENLLRLTTGYSAREKQPITLLNELKSSSETFDIDVTLATQDPIVTETDRNALNESSAKNKWTVATVNKNHGDWQTSIEHLIDHIEQMGLKKIN